MVSLYNWQPKNDGCMHMPRAVDFTVPNAKLTMMAFWMWEKEREFYLDTTSMALRVRNHQREYINVESPCPEVGTKVKHAHY
jgi:hypothetical protein